MQVQRYIAKQKLDRKRRQVEMKKKEKEANEKKLKQLSALDKKQKKALKKSAFEGISACVNVAIPDISAQQNQCRTF